MLQGKRIVLGVSGSIASYKAADIASKLTQAGALVDVVLTDAAQKFIAPLTFRSLTARPVFTDMFDPQSSLAEEHVELARAADAMLIAPASATTLARLAHGMADNMVALTALATTAPVIVAPAMDSLMWNDGNRSSGKMGFAIAEAARDRGASVTLVCGPVALATPYGVERVNVTTTAQMAEAIVCATQRCDALIMAAAPADFRPAASADQKIKRTGANLSIELVPNDDILAMLRGDFVKVGFAAETQDLLDNARAKIAKKGLDLIAANDVTAPHAGFSTDTNLVTLIDASGVAETLPLLSKYDVGQRILDRVVGLLPSR